MYLCSKFYGDTALYDTESDADKLRNVDQVWGQWEEPYKQKEALGPFPLMQPLKRAEPKRLAEK